MQDSVIYDNTFKGKLRTRILEKHDGYYVELGEYFNGKFTGKAMVIRADVFEDANKEISRMFKLMRRVNDNNPPLIPTVPKPLI